jgi:hypothetical protein
MVSPQLSSVLPFRRVRRIFACTGGSLVTIFDTAPLALFSASSVDPRFFLVGVFPGLPGRSSPELADSTVDGRLLAALLFRRPLAGLRDGDASAILTVVLSMDASGATVAPVLFLRDECLALLFLRFGLLSALLTLSSLSTGATVIFRDLLLTPGARVVAPGIFSD